MCFGSCLLFCNAGIEFFRKVMWYMSREMIWCHPKIIRSLLFYKSFPVSFIQHIRLWGPTLCQEPLHARDRSCEKAQAPFPVEPQRISRGKEKSRAGSVACSSWLQYFPCWESQRPHQTYIYHVCTPCTHTMCTHHTCTHVHTTALKTTGVAAAVSFRRNVQISQSVVQVQPQCLAWGPWH